MHDVGAISLYSNQQVLDEIEIDKQVFQVGKFQNVQGVAAQEEDSRFFSPGLTLKKDFFNERFSTTLQWINIDMGLLNSNEQSIATWREGSFYTITNYVYEVDQIILNLTYTFNRNDNKSRFIKSEFGEKEF